MVSVYDIVCLWYGLFICLAIQKHKKTIRHMFFYNINATKIHLDKSWFVKQQDENIKE